MSDLIIEINEKLKFKKITCKENHYITSWDKENILEFYSAKILFTPINVDISKYYCITEEENIAFEEEKERVIREQIDNRNV